jgi:hypothetical protein
VGEWRVSAESDRRELHECPVIGWVERVDLPDWSIVQLRAKSDTGARSSALHVDNIQLLSRNWVRFEVIVSRARRRERMPIETRVIRRALVRSSSGHFARRLFVRTCVRIGGFEREIELSLVDREKMIHRMLLGRSALEGMLVDPRHRYLLTAKRRPRAKRRPAARS